MRLQLVFNREEGENSLTISLDYRNSIISVIKYLLDGSWIGQRYSKEHPGYPPYACALTFGRKNKISHNILEHLDTDNTLNLDGLVNFSLREYLREIRFAVDLAYEDLKSEKQYNDFIRLLKYFVETQPPKAVEVNIYLAENGAFHLWDEKGHVIEQDLIDLYLEDILTNDNNLDDILISILITVAPRRIIFHSLGAVPDTEPARIIKRVFKERIMVCPGCDRCLGHQLRDR